MDCKAQALDDGRAKDGVDQLKSALRWSLRRRYSVVAGLVTLAAIGL